MSDGPTSSRPPRIDAAELSSVEMSDDGRQVCLRLRDGAGRPASVSIPVNSVNAMLSALPRPADALPRGQAQPYKLDGWSLSPAEHGLALTLRLADGAAITFMVQPWQIAAIASLAGTGLGGPAASHRGRLN
jgi:hypothetical protein